MSKSGLHVLVAVLSLLILCSCGHPSAQQVARKYCGMMEEYYKATSEEKQKEIRDKMDVYEKKVRKEKWYTDEFEEQLKAELESCSDALKDKYGNE